jgi:hypothetical protein
VKPKILVPVLCCLLLVNFNRVFAQGIAPYLQAITPSSIAINWKSPVSVSPLIRYGTSDNNLDRLATGTGALLTDVGYSNNYFYQTVKLSGLQPGTKYYYRAVGGNDSSEICSFKTLPQAGTMPASGKMRFLILGDNQIKSQPRYDSLMVAAKRKLTELYGPNFNDSVSFILNLGDQVDVGTLDHYEHVHLAKSRYLSAHLPIQTAVGNHETYGTLKMQAYYDHFVLDSMNYKGIYSGTEDYYAFQAGNVVIAYMNTENTSTAQFNWIQRIVDAANIDPTVKWIITIAHRPYQAEQYVGDISPWIRNTVVPYCMQSPKFFLHVGAHHHLYARGQMKDVPAYNIISGGTAWDQYWGMASEQNFDDVQKTISNWAYQLIEVDMIADKIDVTTFSIGSIYRRKDNVVIDSFHRYKNAVVPARPAIVHNFADSLQLPLTLSGTAFNSAAGELLNSTEFQIASERTFAVLEKTAYRHYEDLFGNVTGSSPDTTKDQNLGVNILDYTLPAGSIPNGWHYVRVRYRDRNQSWSDWSLRDSFKVYNSIVINPRLALDSVQYATGSTIRVTFTNGNTDANAWIGIYKKGQTPGSGTGTSTATAWKYTNGMANGTMTFTLTATDEYFVAYFGNSGYTEIAPRVSFYHGPIPELSIAATNYNVGQSVPVSFRNAPGLSKDWIGIYKIGMTPGGPASIKWGYTTGATGVYNATGLGKGYYFATYFLKDQYLEASKRIYFSVGDTITTLTTNKSVYNLGEYISATWLDGPGNPKDWLGVYHSNDNPNVDPLISYTYIDGMPAGTRNVVDSALPNSPGNYFLVLFTNDSYNEVSNRISFEVMNGALPLHLQDFTGEPHGLSHYLSWKVTGEEAGDRYVLQHATDGKTFNEIFATAIQPALNGQYAYSYASPTRKEDFYRLKIISSNGKESFSKVVKIHQNEDGENKVLIYPNPVLQSNRSIVESPYPIDQIDIMDVNGQMIYQSKNINKNKFSLLHQDLPAGTYIIRIHAAKVFTAKLIVN